MSADIIKLAAPTDRVVRCGGGDTFAVETTISLATKRGNQIITHERTGAMVLARGCSAREDDARIIDAAIEGWRSAWPLAWMRGREAPLAEMVDPELQG